MLVYIMGRRKRPELASIVHSATTAGGTSKATMAGAFDSLDR